MGRTLPGIAGCVGVAFLLLLVLPVCIADAGAIGAESARISGVVIDEAGQPVRGAQVWLATHWFWLDEDGGATGPQETGFVNGQTPAEFELVARRLGEHQGTVRDSAGHAIGGALVEFQAESKRTQARTDAEGRFLLKPAPDGPGMLFVSRDGYRFHGQEVKALAGPLDVRLARFDEPYGQALRPPPPATTPDQRLKIARQLIQEFLDEPRNDARQEDRMLALRSLATFDPAAALAEVQARPLRDGRMNDMVRYEAAKALLDTAPDDALELAEAVGREFPHMTPMLYVRIAAALPADQRQRKLEILGEALVRAQAIQEPGFRLVTVAQVAEGLLDLGEKERGTKLLLENLETAQKFNRSGYDAYLRGAFAEELAQVDLESALALVNEITDYSERTRHLANIAHEIAGQRPADAEKILADYPPPPEGSRLINQKDQYGVRICYRMAGADLVRALRIAEAMEDPFYKAHSFGVMAAAIGPSDRVKAAELVRRGFDSLDEAASRPVQELPVSGGNLGNVGGWLVAQAHELDPELAAETRWRLLRVLPDQPSADPNRRWRDTEALSSAAMFLAQLDPPLARSLLERLDGDPQFVAAGSNSRTWLPAWGMLDPSEAIKRAAMQAAAVRSRAKATLAEAIASSGQARQRLLHYQAGLWRIDVEDIDN